jgi:predicted MPP superfamily phosphohydrolase
MASKPQKLTLLHLSDLHIRDDEEEKTDRSVVLGPLLDRLKKDRKKGLRPELVLITGDIAFQGIKAEYDLALPFLKDLLKVLGLDDERLYLVPGNHDVYHEAYRPGDIPSYKENRDLNNELANYRTDLLKGMRDYFDFVQTHFPHMTSANGDLVPFVDRVEIDGGGSLGLVGLNSAWMCRARKNDESDSGKIAIGQHQIKSAFEELGDRGELDATVAMFHHPLSWLAPMDKRVCEKYLDRTIALAGHLHEPGGGYMHGFTTKMAHIQTGGAYLGSDSHWPSRYHYIVVDLENQRLRLDFRAFSKPEGHWFVDTETGDDNGSAEIPAVFSRRAESASDQEPAPSECPEFPEKYANWLVENYGYLEAHRLNPKAKAPRLELPELYIPLYCTDPRPDPKDTEAERVPSEIEHIDTLAWRTILGRLRIEDMAGKYSALLIEGQAGSGKSTVLKSMAYSASPAASKEPASPQLAGYLPVLVLLKELQAYCKMDINNLDRKCSPGQGLLERYLLNHVSGRLNLETLNGFARCGRLLLLIDGLDEIDVDLRDHAVKALADEAGIHKDNKIVLAGRPHGLEGMPADRFGGFKTSVQELDPDQIELFVRQWYDWLYLGTEGVGRKTADELLGDIKDHPSIDKLTVNPLMLTAICLLYHDERELPDQRAELFKKFIDNMIWRRFPDNPEEVLDRLKGMAHEMHKERVRVLDREAAVKVLAGSLRRSSEEDSAQFRRRKRKLFNDIEPNCGLLVSADGATGFWHLAFQEFLTAQHLMDIHEDKWKAIENLWDDVWYKEVIELYVSYLSIDNRQTANNIILHVLEREDRTPYHRWRLAARTLVDFHQSRRNPDTLEKVKERLNQIILESINPVFLSDAGQTLGWLGDDRDLESFAPVAGGEYELEDIGERTIEAFEIGRYPVTHRFFGKFIKAGGYENRALWNEQGRVWLDGTKATQPKTWSERKYRCPNQPVTGVSWYEAAAFCNWLSAEYPEHKYFLPSEEQWQAAAAGKEQREYPWGDESITYRCNVLESEIGAPSPVGVFANGRTPGNEETSIYDMAGNVWEWTSDPYDEETICAKGGSWTVTAEKARCASRNRGTPGGRDQIVGFRCARTLK